ncbi:hypothetical protein [Nostoc sp. CALU 1950]|uniref:hypothetical protein n=1 Tax=Nostoc sp. CALU 1950 TaxID=3104321 RepID=UPI003EB9A614
MNWSELKNEAISNYIVFVLGVIVGVLGWIITQYISRKKPQVIEVVKGEETSVVEVDSNIKQDIKIEYKGNPVQSLYRTAYYILNRGESTIDNIKFEIQIEDQTQNNVLYSVILDDSAKPLLGATTNVQTVTVGKQEILVNLDFLNPYSGYKEKITLDVYSSSPFQTLTARGRGRGWNVKYFDQIKYSEDINVTISLLVSGTPLAKFTGAVRLLETISQVVLRR